MFLINGKRAALARKRFLSAAGVGAYSLQNRILFSQSQVHKVTKHIFTEEKMKNHKKFIPVILFIACMTTAMQESAAEEVSGRMEITVTLPEILILYHYDLVDIEFTGDSLQPGPDNDAKHEIKKGQADAFSSQELNDVSFTSDNLAISATGSDFDTNSYNNHIQVTLQNVWAVRAISSGNVSLAVSIENSTLKNNDGGTIEVSNATLSTTDIAPSWNPTIGDLTFELDLSNAEYAGLYSDDGNVGSENSESTDTFLLTLTGN